MIPSQLRICKVSIGRRALATLTAVIVRGHGRRLELPEVGVHPRNTENPVPRATKYSQSWSWGSGVSATVLGAHVTPIQRPAHYLATAADA